MKPVKQDQYEVITTQVLQQMQTAGTGWIKPFAGNGQGGQPVNIVSKRAYRGINTLLLFWTPFGSRHWGTYKQWSDKGCQVRKGQKATRIVFWQFIEKTQADGTIKTIPFLKTYSVFNREQVDGEWASTLDAPLPKQSEVELVAAADAWIAGTGAKVNHTSDGRACYSTVSDSITMPHRELFSATPTSTATEAYYSTHAHELVHWTGHKSRLDRNLANAFGSEAYAFEELVAELGAAILCIQLGISTEPRADHAQYLNSWIKVLKGDKRAFMKAAGLAAKAVDFLLPQAQDEDQVEDQVGEAA